MQVSADDLAGTFYFYRSMGIEKDINQVKFKSARQKAMLNVLFSYGWITEKIKQLLAPEDITPQQYNILRILRGANQPISTLQIRERMLDKMSDTSRIVDRLIVKGLVEKRICERDKRLVDVFITEKGRTLLKEMDSDAEQMDKLLQNISEEEAGQLNHLLDTARQKTEAEVEAG